MAKISRATKETIQTIAVVVVALLLIIVYVIYPLNRTKAIMARPDIDTFIQDTLSPNDPAGFEILGLAVDTFRVEADGLTKLACARIHPKADSAANHTGIAVLLHRENADRSRLSEVAKLLADAGTEVIVYDQRASGLSSGKYHSDGQLEALDLEALIGYLEIQGKLRHPLTVVGWGVGADAALIAATDEPRINGVVAIEPYLTTDRFVSHTLTAHDVMWLPFHETIFWWWYKIRSGYAVIDRSLENMAPVKCRTIIALSPDQLIAPEVSRLSEISPKELLTVISADQFDPVSNVASLYK